jgi:hypothetical protein
MQLSMKVPSTLLKAMLLTAAIGATTTSCTTVKSQTESGENQQIQSEGNQGFFDKFRDIFRANSDPCPACGMG